MFQRFMCRLMYVLVMILLIVNYFWQGKSVKLMDEKRNLVWVFMLIFKIYGLGMFFIDSQSKFEVFYYLEVVCSLM